MMDIKNQKTIVQDSNGNDKNELLNYNDVLDCYGKNQLEIQALLSSINENDMQKVNVEFQFQSPLRLAIESNNFDLVELLYMNGAKLNDKVGCYTPLVLAIEKQNFDIVKFLVEKGADVNLKSGEVCPLICAINLCQIDITHYLVNQGANVNIIVGIHTPLCRAVYYGNFELVKFLVQKGADVNLMDPIKWNAKSRDEDSWRVITKYLIEKGANFQHVYDEFKRYNKQIQEITDFDNAIFNQEYELLQMIEQNSDGFKISEESLNLLISDEEMDIAKKIINKIDISNFPNLIKKLINLKMYDMIPNQELIKNKQNNKRIINKVLPKIINESQYDLFNRLIQEGIGFQNIQPFHYTKILNDKQFQLFNLMLIKGAKIGKINQNCLLNLLLSKNYDLFLQLVQNHQNLEFIEQEVLNTLIDDKQYDLCKILIEKCEVMNSLGWQHLLKKVVQKEHQQFQLAINLVQKGIDLVEFENSELLQLMEQNEALLSELLYICIQQYGLFENVRQNYNTVFDIIQTLILDQYSFQFEGLIEILNHYHISNKILFKLIQLDQQIINNIIIDRLIFQMTNYLDIIYDFTYNPYDFQQTVNKGLFKYVNKIVNRAKISSNHYYDVKLIILLNEYGLLDQLIRNGLIVDSIHLPKIIYDEEYQIARQIIDKCDKIDPIFVCKLLLNKQFCLAEMIIMKNYDQPYQWLDLNFMEIPKCRTDLEFIYGFCKFLADRIQIDIHYEVDKESLIRALRRKHLVQKIIHHFKGIMNSFLINQIEQQLKYESEDFIWLQQDFQLQNPNEDQKYLNRCLQIIDTYFENDCLLIIEDDDHLNEQKIDNVLVVYREKNKVIKKQKKITIKTNIDRIKRRSSQYNHQDHELNQALQLSKYQNYKYQDQKFSKNKYQRKFKLNDIFSDENNDQIVDKIKKSNEIQNNSILCEDCLIKKRKKCLDCKQLNQALHLSQIEFQNYQLQSQYDKMQECSNEQEVDVQQQFQNQKKNKNYQRKTSKNNKLKDEDGDLKKVLLLSQQTFEKEQNQRIQQNKNYNTSIVDIKQEQKKTKQLKFDDSVIIID